jgi:signal transduction histidine kinase
MNMEHISRKVLVIDDEIGPRESLRFLLKNDYQVICIDSVAEGLKLIASLQPDLIILDIRMPGMNGIEGLQKIRKIDKTVSVLMLTGFGTLETAQQAVRFGANDYLKKPFNTDEMREAVAFNIQRTEIARRGNAALKELQNLNTDLIAQNSQQEHLASLGQASFELVHDLNNPLSIILGYTQLLVKKLQGCQKISSTEIRETLNSLSVIESNVKRCCELSEVWKNLGKTDPNRLRPVSIPYILDELIKSEELSDIHKRIELVIDWNDYKILGDNIQIYRAIQNIIMNAVQSLTGPNGTVRITCERRESQLAVEVKDNGCGISKQDLEKIFDPYFTTKSSQNGTGLGLFITKKVIENHNGTINVDSEVGKGTTVTLIFPLFGIPVLTWESSVEEHDRTRNKQPTRND